jgi:arylsulfatase A-like enzyme
VEQLERMAAGARPFLLFAHYFDPHYTYMRHAEADFAAPSAGRLDGEQPMRELLRLAPEMSEAEVGFLRDLYDGEIRHTDRGIGELLDRLDELGLRKNTIVVLTADHGEEFLDHGSLGHTSSLYEELLRVPLLVRDPSRGELAPQVVTWPVSLVSLMPTLLDLVGVEAGVRPFQGPSLLPLLDGTVSGMEGPLYAEVDFVPLRKGRLVGEVYKKAVIGERYKLIRDGTTGRMELYDRIEDPLEREDLSEQDAERLAEFAALLNQAIAHAESAALEPQPKRVTDPEIERLKSLGYVGD